MDKKLHVLFLNSWYPSRVSPTNGDFIQRHAEAVSTIHQVTSIHVISDKNLKPNLEIEDQNINGVRTIIGYIKPTKNPLLKFYLYFKTYLYLYKMSGIVDIVHLNVIYPAGLFALYLKWFKKKVFIISEHWSLYKEINGFNVHFLIRSLMKIIAINSSYIAPVTNDLSLSMKKFGLKGTYVPVPNVVNTDLFIPDPHKTDEFTIMHASNMADVKNVKGILNVIKKLELLSIKFTFYLIGENIEKHQKTIDSLKIKQLITINHLPHSEFSVILKKTSVLVLFSKSENLPCVILEAFACGTPVISTNVGGIKEYFPENFGLLIENKEPCLLEALLKIKDHFPKAPDAIMHHYIKNNFSPEVIGRTFSNLYLKSIRH